MFALVNCGVRVAVLDSIWFAGPCSVDRSVSMISFMSLYGLLTCTDGVGIFAASLWLVRILLTKYVYGRVLAAIRFNNKLPEYAKSWTQAKKKIKCNMFGCPLQKNYFATDMLKLDFCYDVEGRTKCRNVLGIT